MTAPGFPAAGGLLDCGGQTLTSWVVRREEGAKGVADLLVGERGEVMVSANGLFCWRTHRCLRHPL